MTDWPNPLSTSSGLLRALIVDDEALARARMRTLLGDSTQPSVVV